MDMIKEYINFLLDGVVDKHEVDLNDGVYNVILIVDMRNREYLSALVPLLRSTGKLAIKTKLKRCLPDDLYVVNHKVIK